MPHTKDELRKMIDLDEPDYTDIVSKLKADDIPLLIELSHDSNMAVATKAVSCLGLMNNEKAVEGIKVAATHNNPIMRIAAAHALKSSSNLPSAVKMIESLLDDQDVGVRKFALKTVNHSNISSLKAKVKLMSEKEGTELMKTLSKEVFNKINH